MSEAEHASPQANFAQKVALTIALVLVVIGLMNTLPSIPGLDGLVAGMTGNISIVVRKFPYEYLFPLAFVLMMTIVAL